MRTQRGNDSKGNVGQGAALDRCGMMIHGAGAPELNVHARSWRAGQAPASTPPPRTQSAVRKGAEPQRPAPPLREGELLVRGAAGALIAASARTPAAGACKRALGSSLASTRTTCYHQDHSAALLELATVLGLLRRLVLRRSQAARWGPTARPSSPSRSTDKTPQLWDLIYTTTNN